jgi:hypothetical protein
MEGALILNPTGFSITPDWTLQAEFRFGHPHADEVEKGCTRAAFLLLPFIG